MNELFIGPKQAFFSVCQLKKSHKNIHKKIIDSEFEIGEII